MLPEVGGRLPDSDPWDALNIWGMVRPRPAGLALHCRLNYTIPAPKAGFPPWEPHHFIQYFHRDLI